MYIFKRESDCPHSPFLYCYDYISLRFYLDIGTAKTVAISLYKVRANNTGIDSPASVYLSINKSGWIDLKIPAEEWIGRQVAFDLGGNGTLTLVITVDGYANTEMSFRIF